MKNLLELLKVKSLVTLAITMTFVYLSVTGKLDQAQYMTIATAVFTYYFTKVKGDTV